MHKGQQRIAYLDGLRGIAILLVMLWHYLGPIYHMHLPYGRAFAWMPGIRHGWAGVNLFFLISGYVIFLTLERCRGNVDFLLRRWLRLFPGMLIASVLILGVAQPLAAEMPGGRAEAIDLLPGLTLINPYYFLHLLDLPVRSLDGAFWSLYVEAAFYLVIGPLFFLLGWPRAIAGLLILYAFILIAPTLALKSGSILAIDMVRYLYHLGFQYFGWFASGALFLKARTGSDRGLFVMAIAIGLAASLTTPMPGGIEPSGRIAMMLAVSFFAVVQKSDRLQRLLEARWLLFLGFVSYPFYLLHSAIGVGLIAMLAPALGGPVLLAPAIVALLMVGLAAVIAYAVEPPVIRLLRPATDAVRRILGSAGSSVARSPSGATPK